MTKLHELYERGGQSPWIDDLKRSYLTQGGLDRLIAEGIRGMTSNPTIMAKAIEAGSDYDEQFSGLVASGVSVDDAYWDLVIEDVNGALDRLRPVYDSSSGGDGFVSLEVAPGVAHDASGTLEMAASLHKRIDKPNLFVKIPATKEGVRAIEDAIAEGHSINVTLIFSLERYSEVIAAYQNGLARRQNLGGSIDAIASVASFFVSRVDTEVDKRLDAIAQSDAGSLKATRALELRGKAAIAQAKLAYELFESSFATPAFAQLQGAARQRPLWASTSTKNPAYPDLYYVENLIGPDSVDTMPESVVGALLDHGTIEVTVRDGLDEARETMAGLAEIGVDIDDVTAQLEREGVSSFAKSFDELLDSLAGKAATLKKG